MALDARSLAWATLAHKALPQRALVALLRAHGNPEAILRLSRAELAKTVAPDVVVRALAPVDSSAIERTSGWLDHPDHHLIAWDDDDYPQALLALGNAPPALFHIGRRDLLNRPAFAIVGSRHGTPQGLENAREFAHALANAGLAIVSGLALGIDAAAHEGALSAEASTIAIVATGLDRVYPARNRDLATRIAKDGALVSEYLPGTPPRKENFSQRNRLISGLSCGVLVVEATLSSGSLITARLGGEQGRDVFAIPGSIHSPFSKGCHKLIREGAKLVETADDILGELALPMHEARSSGARDAAIDASANPILAAMGYDPVGVDALVARTDAPAETIAAALVMLELEGAVAALPGGRWQRLRRA